jgi:hypothetical protein
LARVTTAITMAITTVAIMVAATTEAITRRYLLFPAPIVASQFQGKGVCVHCDRALGKS